MISRNSLRFLFTWALTVALNGTLAWAQEGPSTSDDEIPSVYDSGSSEISQLEAQLRAPETTTIQADTTSIQEEPPSEPGDSSGIPCCDPSGYSFNIGKNATFKVGAGLRASFNSIEDGSPNGRRWSNDVFLDNMRLYFSGEMFEYLAFEFNTDINNAQGFEDTVQILPAPGVNTNLFEEAGEVRILDAIVKFQPHDYFNVWLGRLLPPSDRSNLDGPFFLNAWEFPFVQFGYPNIFQGRDDGVAVWGQVCEGMFKWQTGVFKGTEGFPNADDHVMWTGRLVLNLLDPEPGYYNQSTYYGEKDILAIGVALMDQRDAVGTIADPEDFTGWNIDVLFEKKLWNGGVITFEGAFYDFDDDDATVIEPTPGRFTDLTRQGESYFLLASYLCACKVGCGKVQGQLQPYVRWQEYDRDFTSTSVPLALRFDDGLDIGLNYIIDGHNARVSLVYERREPGPGLDEFDQIRIGAQLQF